jgi:hypothetical protein
LLGGEKATESADRMEQFCKKTRNNKMREVKSDRDDFEIKAEAKVHEVECNRSQREV